MEKIQRQHKLYSLDQKVNVGRSIEVQASANDQSFGLEEDKFSIPFLQMLQQSEDPSTSVLSFKDPSTSVLSFKDPNFIELLSLQTLDNPWGLENYNSSQELSLNPQGNENPGRKRRDNNLVTSMTREKRKRKRSKPTKNKEEMENQRMTHIAIERNRRRQMNVHLDSLRSIIPSSYIQKGDQASIVGGAIDFVKTLEQHLQSLEAQKVTTQQSESKDENLLRRISSNTLRASDEEQSCELGVFVTVLESYVNLRIQCARKQGQLLRSIILLEKLGFTVLHLNITSPTNASVTYSYNLKIEDDCDLRSADDITTAVRQIFDG